MPILAICKSDERRITVKGVIQTDLVIANEFIEIAKDFVSLHVIEIGWNGTKAKSFCSLRITPATFSNTACCSPCVVLTCRCKQSLRESMGTGD